MATAKRRVSIRVNYQSELMILLLEKILSELKLLTGNKNE